MAKTRRNLKTKTAIKHAFTNLEASSSTSESPTTLPRRSARLAAKRKREAESTGEISPLKTRSKVTKKIKKISKRVSKTKKGKNNTKTKKNKSLKAKKELKNLKDNTITKATESTQTVNVTLFGSAI